MIKLLKREKKDELDEAISKQLGVQYIQIFKILEKMKELDEKIQENQLLLKDLSNKYVKLNKEKNNISLKEKTKVAIKLILKKYEKMTSDQLSKIIQLSRTRCSEYLKELEDEKLIKGEIINRKKYFSIK